MLLNRATQRVSLSGLEMKENFPSSREARAGNLRDRLSSNFQFLSPILTRISRYSGPPYHYNGLSLLRRLCFGFRPPRISTLFYRRARNVPALRTRASGTPTPRSVDAGPVGGPGSDRSDNSRTPSGRKRDEER